MSTLCWNLKHKKSRKPSSYKIVVPRSTKIWQQNLPLIFPYKDTLFRKIMYSQMIKPLLVMLGTEPGKHIEMT